MNTHTKIERERGEMKKKIDESETISKDQNTQRIKMCVQLIVDRRTIT